MDIKSQFELALIDQEFEASDEKLSLWNTTKRNNSELMRLISLAMEFAYEQGLVDSDGE